MYFSDEYISEIKSIDILSLLEHYGIEVERNGKCLCPFHEDHDPSMLINKNKNRLECYVCNKKWDSISFVQDKENVSFRKSVEILAKMQGKNFTDAENKNEISILKLTKKEKEVLGINSSELFSKVPNKPIKVWSCVRTEKECFPNFCDDSDKQYKDGYLELQKPQLTEYYICSNYPDMYKSYVIEKIRETLTKVQIQRTKGIYLKNEEEMVLKNLIKKFGYQKAPNI